MEITISKTDFTALMSLIDKSVGIIKDKEPTLREYNCARRLYLVKKKIIKRNEKAIHDTFGK